MTEQGTQKQDSYSIKSITDLALMPDTVFEKNDVFKQLEFFILHLRVIVAALKCEGWDDAQIQSFFENHTLPLTFIDDGKTSASFEFNDECFYRAEAKEL